MDDNQIWITPFTDALSIREVRTATLCTTRVNKDLVGAEKICKIIKIALNLVYDRCILKSDTYEEAGIQHMEQFARNWDLPWCQCSHAPSKQKYSPVPGVSNATENHFCPESARCCAGCVIRRVPIRFWRMSHGRVVRTLDTAVRGGVSGNSGPPLRRWCPAHESIRS